MIWALIVLAVLPLVMGAMMIFILRSGRLHRMREDGVQDMSED
jgi:uncharacterized integral membrane protein